MNNISNIHKSISFTIIVIISTFVGIILSLHYSNSKNHYFFTESFENSSDTLKKYSKLDDDYSSIGGKIVNFENMNYPEFSVPVQLVLGKIKKVNNPYLPKLELAFLENDTKNFILNRDLNIKR